MFSHLEDAVNILIIEDDPLSLRFVDYLLNRSDLPIAAVDHARNIAEARTCLASAQYNVILLDLDLPDSAGQESVSTIRRIAPHSAIVVITGGYGKGSGIESLRNGAQDYLLKGDFGLSTLVRSIRYSMERFNVQNVLYEAERKYKVLIEDLRDVVLRILPDGTVDYCSPAMLMFAGYAPEEVEGGVIDPYFCNEEQLYNAKAIFKQIVVKGTEFPPKDFCFKTKDGRRIIAEVTAKRVCNERMQNVVQCVLRDVTERNDALRKLEDAYLELQETQTVLVQTEKMAALGKFLSGIMHDVKNPLQIVLGGVEYLECRLKDEDSKVVLSKLKDAVLRANGILMSLLKYACPSELKIEWVDVCLVLRGVVEMMRYQPDYKEIDFQMDGLEKELQIAVDRNQLEQVLFNMLINSAQAVDQKKGIIEISVDSESVDGVDRDVIYITDNGPGVCVENRARIFEPFFSTKKNTSSEGSGLGLFMARMIMRNYKGDIWLGESNQSGTQFKIILPKKNGGQYEDDHGNR